MTNDSFIFLYREELTSIISPYSFVYYPKSAQRDLLVNCIILCVALKNPYQLTSKILSILPLKILSLHFQCIYILCNVLSSLAKSVQLGSPIINYWF